MDWSRKSLHRRVSENPRRLVFIHTLVAVGSAVLLTVLDHILMGQVSETGGLSGMGSRAMLETARTALQYGGTLLLPFWELGLLFAALNIARGGQARTGDLCEGFRRFWPALRLMLLRVVIYGCVAMACLNLSVMVFMFTPLSGRLDSLLEPYAAQGQDAQAFLEQVSVAQLQSAVLPWIVLFVVIFAVVMIPLVYRLRFAEMAVMDEPGTGAFAALRSSNRRMKQNCFKVFRVDLQFWWFYLLQAFLAVLCYGDTLLSLCGVQLPFEGGFFLFYGLYALGQIVLHSLFWGRIQITYALVYDDLKEKV